MVKKGTWANSQVAVKVFPSEMVTHRIVSIARKEAQVMESVKHVNVGDGELETRQCRKFLRVLHGVADADDCDGASVMQS